MRAPRTEKKLRASNLARAQSGPGWKKIVPTPLLIIACNNIMYHSNSMYSSLIAMDNIANAVHSTILAIVHADLVIELLRLSQSVNRQVTTLKNVTNIIIQGWVLGFARFNTR